MANELLITISADTKSVKQAFDDVKSQTENLEGALETIAKVSGAAFAALTAQVGVAVFEFAKADTASRQLSESLQDQGIFTKDLKDSYADFADEISDLTGVSKTQITQAQSVAQTYLGQIPITKELTQSIVDLAAKQGVSLPEAAKELGLAIGNGTGMLLRQGLQFSSTSTEAQRFGQTLQFVQTYAGGAAEAISPVTLSLSKLKTAAEENQVALGAEFAPAITAVIDALTGFIKPAKDTTGVMNDMKAAIIVAGLAVSGFAAASAIGTTAIIAIRAALIALNSQLTVTSVILKSLGIGLVIAAVAAGITLVIENFDKLKPVLAGVFEYIKQGFSGVGEIIQGTMNHNVEMIKEGLATIKGAYQASTFAYQEELQKQAVASMNAGEKQIAEKKALADKLAGIKKAQSDAAIALQEEEDEYIQMEINGASDKQLALEKQKIELLKLLANKKNGDDKSALQARISQIEELQEKADTEEEKRTESFNKSQLAAQKTLGDTSVKYQTDLDQKELNAIKKTQMTEQDAKKKVYTDELKKKIDSNNTLLQETAKYGVAYATINQAIHSEEVQGFQQAANDLAQMTQSKNATLKAIGKVFAIENIIMKTAESAMNIYAGFSAIPIVGIALGVAGAAAAVAFGAEQIGNVTAANSGGVIPGYGPNQDSALLFATPGELVAPRQNFEEVINGTIQQRGYTQSGESGSSQQSVAVQIGFDGRQAQQVLTASQVQARALGTYRATS